jgi:hypothetical protein
MSLTGITTGGTRFNGYGPAKGRAPEGQGAGRRKRAGLPTAVRAQKGILTLPASAAWKELTLRSMRVLADAARAASKG